MGDDVLQPCKAGGIDISIVEGPRVVAAYLGGLLEHRDSHGGTH
jgi:hypothetical protein